jgi:maltokinase
MARAGWPDWADELERLIPTYLGAQRWFSGDAAPVAGQLAIAKLDELWASDGGDRRLWHLYVSAGTDCYQLLLAQRPAGSPADFLHGHEEAVVGAIGDFYFYDATLDSEQTKALLGLVSGGDLAAKRVRPLSAEQSNTSLVFDDKVVLKVFRRLYSGENPDVEVTTALAAGGFDHVAEPMVRWRDNEEGYDLAFGQRFLAGGVDGWALALTSLRDLYNTDTADAPAEAGGDFAAEAARLGRMSADMHVGLARVLPMATPAEAGAAWGELVDGLPGRLARAGEVAGLDLAPGAATVLKRLQAVADPGPFIRVHGDFHLGQVMRTDAGWFVLDFEGEPAKPLDVRRTAASPLKDVTGMLRSFHYASRHALIERALAEWGDLERLARAWEAHNRQAFLDGYRSHPGIDTLLPADDSDRSAVLVGYELDKTLYEFDYERSYRPDWVSIPVDALDRLVHGGFIQRGLGL